MLVTRYILELLLLGIEAARGGGDNHRTDGTLSCVAVTKDAVPESFRLSLGRSDVPSPEVNRSCSAL